MLPPTEFTDIATAIAGTWNHKPACKADTDPADCSPGWFNWRNASYKEIAPWTWQPWMEGVITEILARSDGFGGVRVTLRPEPLEIRLKKLDWAGRPGPLICEADCLL